MTLHRLNLRRSTHARIGLSAALYCGVAAGMLVPNFAEALPWVPIANPIAPAPGRYLPGPDEVPGKDFSDIRDRDAVAIFDPQQVVAWDGSGGVRDTYDYSGTQPAPVGQQNDQVDGLGAGGDALFHAVRDNQAALIFSVEGDPDVLFERETGLPNSPPGFGVWATALDIDATNPPVDTDGLEVWGGDNNDDSDRYSLTGDPPLAGSGKVAVWSFTPPLGPSAPHTLTTDLAAAMDLQFAGVGVGGPYWSQLVELMDVDAIMTFGPQITYSIRPVSFEIPGPAGPVTISFDGGEIFEYDGAGVATRFLKHGGHTWDTGFDVIGTFGVNSENIDAIEGVASVPEPNCIALLMLGMAGFASLARRR